MIKINCKNMSPGCFFTSLLLLVCGVFLIALWTDRNLEFWFSYVKETPVVIPYWISLILTIVLNGISIIANILAELAKFLV